MLKKATVDVRPPTRQMLAKRQRAQSVLIALAVGGLVVLLMLIS